MLIRSKESNESDFEIILLLNRIIDEKSYSKKDLLIRIFQNKVWVERKGCDEGCMERMLFDLAYDLDSFVPSITWKSKKHLLEDHLFRLIVPAIENIQSAGRQTIKKYSTFR